MLSIEVYLGSCCTMKLAEAGSLGTLLQMR